MFFVFCRTSAAGCTILGSIQKQKNNTNHPESDSLFYDFAFLSTSVPIKASCIRDHSSGQQEICTSPQELPLFCFFYFVFSMCSKEESIRDVWIKSFLEHFSFEFFPLFIAGKHMCFHLDWHKNFSCLQTI